MKTIKQLMSNLDVVANAETTAENLIKLMHQHNISAIPVTHETEKDTIVGIVTESDLYSLKDTHLDPKSLMNTQLYYINIDDSISNAAGIMINSGVHHLFVKDNDKVVGMLSATDLLKLIADQSSGDQSILFFV